ncbi:MAG: hypothetical protein KDE46_07075 [Caldilineaceae bacterium]|nr:hypothetical protein [Caldilineaceae bacterium]
MNLRNRLERLESQEEAIQTLALKRLTDDELGALIAWLDAPDGDPAPYERFCQVCAEVARLGVVQK